jgi:hypothetical protein
MFRKLVVAGALLGSLSVSAQAEDYYVLRLEAGESAECIVAPSPPEPAADKVKVGGPYASKAQAEEAMLTLPACTAEQGG